MKAAFIIPIHPKHYNYIYHFIDIIHNNKVNIDIYLVFSNENEYNIFRKKDEIKKIIIPYVNTQNIVTYKKFFALEKMKDDINYDYFIVCDAEIDIIPENFNETNIINKIRNIYENKLIYAGEVLNNNTVININKHSINLITDGYKLQNITKNYSLYFWWSDLPVYKRDHLTHFFSLFKYDNIGWFHFDHLIYLSYLLLHHNFVILDITSLLDRRWSLEAYHPPEIESLHKLKAINYGFSYITKPLYDKYKDFLIKEGSFLLYHLDRYIDLKI
jgi:hypothetical protein